MSTNSLHVVRLSCCTGVGALCDNNGSLYTTDASKAVLLNYYFSSVISKNDGVLPEFDRFVPEDVSNVTFTPKNIMKAMRKLKNNTSCGTESLPHTWPYPYHYFSITQYLLEKYLTIGRKQLLPKCLRVALHLMSVITDQYL